jgi:hypothetical protein
MTRLVQAMHEDAADDGEMEELSRNLQVHFKPPKSQPKKPQAKKVDNTDDIRKALAATGSAKKKKGTLLSYGLEWLGRRK